MAGAFDVTVDTNAKKILELLRTLRGNESAAELDLFFGELAEAVYLHYSAHEDPDSLTPNLITALVTAGVAQQDTQKASQLYDFIEQENLYIPSLPDLDPDKVDDNLKLAAQGNQFRKYCLLTLVREMKVIKNENNLKKSIAETGPIVSVEEFKKNVEHRVPLNNFLQNLNASIALIDKEIIRLSKNITVFRFEKMSALTPLKESLEELRNQVQKMTPQKFSEQEKGYNRQGRISSFLKEADNQVKHYSSSFKKILAQIACIFGIELFKNGTKELLRNQHNFFATTTGMASDKSNAESTPTSTQKFGA